MKKNYIFALLLMLSISFPALGSGFLFLPGPANSGGSGGGGGSAAIDHAHYRITGTPGKGSTNTNIVRFPVATWPSVNMTDSATLGTYYTVVADGFCSASFSAVAAAGRMALKKAASLNNSVADGDLDYVNSYQAIAVTSGYDKAYPDFAVSAGDKIWVISSGALSIGFNPLTNFRVSCRAN